MVEYSETLDAPACTWVNDHPRYVAICAAVNRRPWGVLKDGSAEDLPAPKDSDKYGWEAWHG